MSVPWSSAVAVVQKRIMKDIRWLERELQDLDSDPERFIQESPVWRAREDLLRSVPGVGPNLARTLIAELPDLGRLSRKEIAALAGDISVTSYLLPGCRPSPAAVPSQSALR